MTPIEKDRITEAVKNGMQDALDQIRDILDKYDIVFLKADINAIAENAIRTIETKS